MPARVVVGIDGSAHAWKALDWAAAYARTHRLSLVLVHASRALRSGAGLPEAAREQLAAERTDMLNEARRYALKQFPEVEIGVRVSTDDPGRALVAESEQAALVVVGSRGQGGFEGLLFGSVGLHVAGHARCPVLVVPRTAPYPADAPDAIVVGIEGRHPEEHAIGWAFEHAALTGARLIALHAVGGEFGSPYQRLVEDMELAEALAGWTQRYPDVRVVPR
ncbi:MAG: universal stress protein, partial [Actinomadura rubrobrunea]|nr:universal stress protein [Actinomadura rubrobrunea]